jgi:hypothetical protein
MSDAMIDADKSFGGKGSVYVCSTVDNEYVGLATLGEHILHFTPKRARELADAIVKAAEQAERNRNICPTCGKVK